MTHEIISQVKDGKLTRNIPQLTEVIKSFEGKEITIKIEKRKKKRSNPQNAYYWSVCLEIVRNCLKEAGNTFSINDVHELLKCKFLKETILVNEETGECIERIKSTTELSTVQFMDYIMEIQKLTEEWFGVIIPNPNEQLIIE